MIKSAQQSLNKIGPVAREVKNLCVLVLWKKVASALEGIICGKNWRTNVDQDLSNNPLSNIL